MPRALLSQKQTENIYESYQAVRRNEKRFPKVFMFQVTKEEMEDWKSQIVISNSKKMGLKNLAAELRGTEPASSAKPMRERDSTATSTPSYSLWSL